MSVEYIVSLINFQGLTDLKSLELTNYISKATVSLNLLCLVETHHRNPRSIFPSDVIQSESLEKTRAKKDKDLW